MRASPPRSRITTSRSGPNDRVPTDPVSVAVALADKIDTLVGFWAIDEKPTGSKDPYALRRAALGAIRIVLEKSHRIALSMLIAQHMQSWLLSEGDELRQVYNRFLDAVESRKKKLPIADFESFFKLKFATCLLAHEGWAQVVFANVDSAKQHEIDTIESDEIIQSFVERVFLLNDYLEAITPERREPLEASFFSEEDRQEANKRWKIAQDFVEGMITKLSADALGVLRRPPESSTPRARLRVTISSMRCSRWKARTISSSSSAASRRWARCWRATTARVCSPAYKRATNILRIEEKKDGRTYRRRARSGALHRHEERDLAAAIATAKQNAEDAVAREDFAAAMQAIATLRPFVDAFFEKVTVNVPTLQRAREPPQAAERNPRGNARGRGLLQDRRLNVTGRSVLRDGPSALLQDEGGTGACVGRSARLAVVRIDPPGSSS